MILHGRDEVSSLSLCILPLLLLLPPLMLFSLFILPCIIFRVTYMHRYLFPFTLTILSVIHLSCIQAFIFHLHHHHTTASQEPHQDFFFICTPFTSPQFVALTYPDRSFVKPLIKAITSHLPSRSSFPASRLAHPAELYCFNFTLFSVSIHPFPSSKFQSRTYNPQSLLSVKTVNSKPSTPS